MTGEDAECGTPSGPAPVGRRTVLGGGFVAAGAALAGAAVSRVVDTAPTGPGASPPPSPAADAPVGFAATAVAAEVGPLAGLQPGIATPQQAHASFVGLDLRPSTDRTSIVRMLRLLGDDADALMAGQAPLGALEAQPAGAPSRLSVTFGFGPGAFSAAGLADRCPAGIARFPAFTTDRFEPGWGQTDLVIQIAADDAVAVAYAQRRLLRDAAAFTRPVWVQRGFVNARGAHAGDATPRNLMGMLDGSANEKNPVHVAEVVRCTDATQPWLVGGSHLVLRRIRIDLDRWDDVDSRTKEASFGRRLDDGAPLTGRRERDAVDRHARNAAGFLVIDPAAHAARAQARNGAERMLRRAYNYDDGPRPDGTADAGLLFVAYQADVRSAFVPVQRRLAELDALNTWTTHVGSAVYAVPPAARPGSYVGAGLLDVPPTPGGEGVRQLRHPERT